jgi:3-isopropylmalate/(R)-2-methylmalate dehydratase small subunit
MEPFKVLTSRTVVLPEANIDTDQIIPARFLTTTTKAGLGREAFHDWRYTPDGQVKPDCILNTIDPAEHRVLVGGRNFGCGSSREHAPWALTDFGFRAVISTEIADIFTSNALKNGLLPVVVDEETHTRLLEHPGEPITIDLPNNELRMGNHVVRFQVEPFSRECLLEGVDTLGWLIARIPAIEAFEKEHAA